MDSGFWEHIEELRGRLLTVFAIILVGTLLVFSIYPTIHSLLITYPLKTRFSLFEEPIKTTQIKKIQLTNQEKVDKTIPLPEGLIAISHLSPGSERRENQLTLPPGGVVLLEMEESPSLVILGPMDGIVASLKGSFWCSLILTSPFWGAQILLFILPALQRREKRLFLPFLFVSFLSLTTSLVVAFTCIIPVANQILSLYNHDLGVPLYSISNYLSFTLLMSFATVVTFQAGVILFFLIFAGVLEAERLIQSRRYVIVAIFILSALVTPPDVPTQLMMAIPLCILYECGIFFARLRRKRRGTVTVLHE